ncbi:DUF4397 domain-containing protein [Flectobacillus major]|uniref:DUF4397 domain-containing protein n=1 Tax=Flectobacillus major TaxID=103 RepID=UPI0004275E2B|nr:DUF4397 domain-containing protein [Flectobacillus major]
MTIHSKYLWGIISIIALSLTSCKKSYLDFQEEGEPLSAKIRFVNARNNGASIHFWTYITRVTSSLVTQNQSTNYINTQFGDVQISFSEGSNSTLKASTQFGNAATFGASGGPNGPIPDYYHTVFAIRKKNSVTNDSLILFYDDLVAPAAGKAKVRFVHLAPLVSDIRVKANSNTLFNSIAYGRAGNSIIAGTGLSAYSLGPFVSVDAGTLRFELTKIANESNLALARQEIAVQEGKIYTIYLSGVTDTALTLNSFTHN